VVKSSTAVGETTTIEVPQSFGSAEKLLAGFAAIFVVTLLADYTSGFVPRCRGT
jgi:hypothetical protein